MIPIRAIPKIQQDGIGGFIKYALITCLSILSMPLVLIDKVGKIVSMSFRLFGNILGGSIVFYLLIQLIGTYKIYFMILAAITLTGYMILERIADERRFALPRKVFNILWLTFYVLACTELFFGVFEGLIQAFVVSMLTITYLSVSLVEHQEEQEKELVS